MGPGTAGRRPARRARRAGRTLALVYAILVVDAVVGSLLYPIWPRFAEATSNPTIWLGVSYTLFAFMQFLAAPVLGLWSDAHGRRPVFRLAAVGTLLAMVLALPLRLWPFLANRVLDGTTNGLYAVSKSAVVDLSPPEQIQRNVGLMGTLTYAGFILGPGVAALVLWVAGIAGWSGPRSLVVAGLVFAAVNLVLSFRLPETRAPGADRPAFGLGRALAEVSPAALLRRTRRLRAEDPVAARLIGVQAMLYLALGYYTYFFTYVSQGPLQLDERAISVVFAYFSVIGIVANTVFFARVSRVRRADRVLALVLLSGVAVMGLYAVVGSSLVALLAVLLVDVVTVSLAPGLLEGLLGRSTHESRRGEVFGLLQGVASLMTVVSALVATFLAGIDVRLPFAFFAAALLLAAVAARPAPSGPPVANGG